MLTYRQEFLATCCRWLLYLDGKRLDVFPTRAELLAYCSRLGLPARWTPSWLRPNTGRIVGSTRPAGFVTGEDP